jgi:subtilisin family serine protease
MNTSLSPRSTTHRAVLTALALVLAVLTAVAGLSSPAPASAATAGPDAAPEGDWARLEQLAAQEGSVRVIVTLDTPAAMPHTLSGAALRNQKSAVVHDRNTLRQELGNRKLRSLKVMDDMPLVAFSATPEDIAALQESEVVSSVAVDEERNLPAPQVDRSATQPAARPTKPADAESAQPAGTTSNGFSNQLSQWWDYYRVGVDKASGAGYTGNGQVVAVLDTGVDRFHPWLQGDVVAEACFATDTAGTGGACPNGSWYQYGAGAAAPCQQSACSHGTHVAHTAVGTYGVAPGARLIAVQVFHPTSSGPRTWDSDLTWGLKYVYDLRTSYRIASVNMSLGGGAYRGYCDSAFSSTSNQGRVLGWMKALAGVGIATVVASGNDNYSQYLGQPACFSTAISVGNTTMTGTGADAVFGNASYVGTDGRTYWTGSNSNATLDLLAPGTDICSAMPNNMMNCGMSGTSMAAPHVAGAFAVLRQSRPAATIQQVVAALHRSGTSVYDGRNGITRSRIDVYKALGIIHQM